MNHKLLGDFGEKISKKYLERLDYEIIKTNFSCRQGEIDIIAFDREELVFIEVKTRINKKFGYAIEAVNGLKQKHIRTVAQYFVYKYNLENYFMRFDIIEIYLERKKYFLNHVKNVMW